VPARIGGEAEAVVPAIGDGDRRAPTGVDTPSAWPKTYAKSAEKSKSST
jgi:hypothetical protein